MAFLSSLNLPGLLFVACLTGVLSVVIYRLLFHPLSRVPGPKLAAISRLYDFYYDCVLGGKFVFKIDELHDQYGELALSS
jgi:hypothetical protein